MKNVKVRTVVQVMVKKANLFRELTRSISTVVQLNSLRWFFGKNVQIIQILSTKAALGSMIEPVGVRELHQTYASTK